VVVQGSELFVKARTERRMPLSIVEDGVWESGEGLTVYKRLRERRPRVPICLARKPECILCSEERAGLS
jgi:hypothetical protein